MGVLAPGCSLVLSETLCLSPQLRELEDKYAECMEMLHEAQEELKNRFRGSVHYHQGGNMAASRQAWYRRSWEFYIFI